MQIPHYTEGALEQRCRWCGANTPRQLVGVYTEGPDTCCLSCAVTIGQQAQTLIINNRFESDIEERIRTTNRRRRQVR